MMTAVDKAPLSRRTFLLGTAVVVAAAGSQVAGVDKVGASTSGSSSPVLTRATFAPFLNSTFQLSNGPQSVPVVLSGIQDLVPALTPGEEHRFSLMFRAPAGQPLPQAVRQVSQPGIGQVALLVVPVDRGRTNQYYQAIINRSS
jgi:hypothetical protein